MKMQELIEHYIITAERGMIGIQCIRRNIITEKMGTIKFVLANKYFLNKRNIISCFTFVKQIFEEEFRQTNTKFKIEYGQEMSVCKILIVL